MSERDLQKRLVEKAQRGESIIFGPDDSIQSDGEEIRVRPNRFYRRPERNLDGPRVYPDGKVIRGRQP